MMFLLKTTISQDTNNSTLNKGVLQVNKVKRPTDANYDAGVTDLDWEWKEGRKEWDKQSVEEMFRI